MKQRNLCWVLILTFFFIKTTATILETRVISRLSITADNTFEAYLNNKELLPPDEELWNKTIIDQSYYHSKYCSLDLNNTLVQANRSRCSWQQGDSFNVTVQTGDLLQLKYYNFPFQNRPLVLLDIFEYCTNVESNACGFMAEFISVDSINTSYSIDWKCTPGNFVSINGTRNNVDMNSDESKLWNNSESYKWSPPSLAAKNEKYAWRNVSKANPPGQNVSCIGPSGNSPWNTLTVNSFIQPRFTTDAEWLYNVFPNTTYAYCRGIISIIFSSTVLLANNGSFSFYGTQLVLQGAIVLSNTTSLNLQENQTLNFSSGCVTLGGNLTLYVNSSQEEKSITPVLYQCRANTSQFDQINLIDLRDTDGGCQLNYKEEYGSKGLDVLFYNKCGRGDGGDGTNRNIIIGVVVAVGGYVIILLVVALIVITVSVLVRRWQNTNNSRINF